MIRAQLCRYLVIGCLFMALAVILGAFGAHGLKAKLSEHYFDVFLTANKYHFIHALGMMVGILSIHFCQLRDRVAQVFFTLMLAGMLCFSAALYVLSVKELIGLDALSIMGAIAPIGGLSWILGWGYLALSIYRVNRA